MNKTKLTPLLKYPGGKSKELPYLIDYFPNEIDKYIEPFIGGGAVYWSINANEYLINDLSEELIELYRLVKSQNENFFNYISQIEDCWKNKEKYSGQIELLLHNAVYYSDSNEFDFSRLSNNLLENYSIYNNVDRDILSKILKKSFNRKSMKLKKIAQTQEINNIKQNAHTILGDAIYGLNRKKYNDTNIQMEKEFKVSLYLFLREYAYSSMFRFNSKGDFNVPFGGNSYVSKSLKNKINYYKEDSVISKLANTRIYNTDYLEFFNQNFSYNDFAFFDPPYDTEFSTYDNNSFDKENHKQLADLLSILQCKWLLVIKNTDFIFNLYNNGLNYIDSFNKNYSVNFNNRNDKKVTHLIITNYKI